ncbi:MAG: 4Fe-4S dicluster domain-containing protein [Chloroflexota bacterium]
MSDKAVLFDATRCTACRGCQVACKQWNELTATSTTCQGTYENPPDLSPNTWLTIRFGEKLDGGNIAWLFGRRSCMHCTDAACVEVCPSGALFHNEYGFVSHDKAKCIGCGYCVEFCPFHVPRLDGNIVTGLGKMYKCTLCTTPGLNRLSIGQEPACVKTCPPHALMYGDREKLLAEGRRRVAGLKSSRREASLYGETELGGLHVLYVLADSPQAYGLPPEPAYPVTASIQRGIFRPFAWMLWGAVAVGLAANVVVARARQKHHKEEA